MPKVCFCSLTVLCLTWEKAKKRNLIEFVHKTHDIGLMVLFPSSLKSPSCSSCLMFSSWILTSPIFYVNKLFWLKNKIVADDVACVSSLSLLLLWNKTKLDSRFNSIITPSCYHLVFQQLSSQYLKIILKQSMFSLHFKQKLLLWNMQFLKEICFKFICNKYFLYLATFSALQPKIKTKRVN